jgi:transcription elongation factor GreB
MTPVGAKKLRDEYEELFSGERPKLLETIAWAAGNGDRSENADYLYGKRRLREIDRRLRYLSSRIDDLVVVDPSLQKSDSVLFGASVTVSDEDGESVCYRIVGVDETEPARYKISWISPIGKALLGAKIGSIVKVQTPKGETELEILDIKYIEID